MTQYVIEQREDFFVTYDNFVKVRYLAEKIDHGPANIERKIEGIINVELGKYLKRKAGELGFDYWIDQKKIDDEKIHKRRQEEFSRMAKERVIREEAQERIIEDKMKEIKKERKI